MSEQKKTVIVFFDWVNLIKAKVELDAAKINIVFFCGRDDSGVSLDRGTLRSAKVREQLEDAHVQASGKRLNEYYYEGLLAAIEQEGGA